MDEKIYLSSTNDCLQLTDYRSPSHENNKKNGQCLLKDWKYIVLKIRLACEGNFTGQKVKNLTLMYLLFLSNKSAYTQEVSIKSFMHDATKSSTFS